MGFHPFFFFLYHTVVLVSQTLSPHLPISWHIVYLRTGGPFPAGTTDGVCGTGVVGLDSGDTVGRSNQKQLD